MIVGRSNLVGKPLAALLVQKRKGCNATVTIAHQPIGAIRRNYRTADILIAAIGRRVLSGKGNGQRGLCCC